VHTVTIDIPDFTPPAPTSETVNCYADILLPTPPTVFDACGIELIPTGPVESGVPACEGDITYTWTYSDCAGSTHDYVHTVTIDIPDFSPPAPTSETVNCYADILLPTPPTVFDACGTELISTGPVESGVPACEGDITYTWTYTDCAGSTHDYVHTVSIDIPDFTPPSPTSETANCYADIILPTPPTVFDACGNEITPSGPVESGIPVCEGDITYTWTYTDCAGSTHDYVHTVTIDIPDFAPPAPTSETVDCYADIVLPAPPTVFDACGTELIPTGPVESGVPACEGDITYTWT
jgi:cytosine/uracil/thiamine/allantoin permease